MSTSVDEIQNAVASYYGLAQAQLTSSSRAASVSWPRQVAIHLTRSMTDASLQAIGDAFGGRNHATVLHACRRVTERMDIDQQAVDEVQELTNFFERRGVGHDASCPGRSAGGVSMAGRRIVGCDVPRSAPGRWEPASVPAALGVQVLPHHVEVGDVARQHALQRGLPPE